MKPPKDPSLRLVLDTKPECKILLDYMYENAFAAHIPTGHPSLYDRFISETHEQGWYLLNWRDNPEFGVTPRDVGILVEASKFVVEETDKRMRFFNRITGHTKAAKGLLAVLTSEEA